MKEILIILLVIATLVFMGCMDMEDSGWECAISIDTTKEGCQPTGGVPTHMCQLTVGETSDDFAGQFMPTKCEDFCYKRSKFEETYPKECITVDVRHSG